jgi:hypothetical protein
VSATHLGAGALPPADRITRRERWARRAQRLKGRALCLSGKHWWRHHVAPDVGGPWAHYHLCARCGKERTAYPHMRHFA